jgi:alkyldihydroxyacetonephosphate synthase
MKWWGWGHPERRFELKDPPGFWAYLESVVGPLPPPEPVAALDQIALPPSGLLPEELADLRKIVGDDGVWTDPETRLRHALGKAYIDLLRLRQGRLSAAPDAVIFPENEDRILELLRLAAEKKWALIPFGGGTTVVGGIEAEEGRISITLDLQKMNRILSLDRDSGTVRAQSGISGPDLERHLNAAGLTLGHFPQSFEYSTLGGWIATRSAGQNSTKYGKIEEMVTGLRMVTPRGVYTAPAMPGEAVGPSLPQCMIGSEGVLGVISEATVRLRHVPARRTFAGYFMPDFLSGVDAVRRMLQADIYPAVIRVSDADETGLALVLGRSSRASFQHGLLRRYLKLRGLSLDKGALVVMIFEGEGRGVSGARREARRHFKAGVNLGRHPARHWMRSRFDHPYLRDDLLERSVMVDTLETAAPWHRIPALYTRVRNVLLDSINKTASGSLVMTHLSHAYPDGASLYFTFMARQQPGQEMKQWLTVKAAATVAILENGGTLSHHHGIGTLHKPWVKRYLGEQAFELLKQIKFKLDPDNIMNPGKLV